MSRTLKNIGCRYIQAATKSEYANRVNTRFCINFVFERAVPFSYRVIYTFPVYCHCRRWCSVNARSLLGIWIFFFMCFLCCCCCCCSLSVVFFHTLIRSFKILFAFASFHTVLLHSFVFRCWCYFFFFSSVSFHFILLSFLLPFPSSLRALCMCVCFVRSLLYRFFSVSFLLLSNEHSICFSRFGCFSFLVCRFGSDSRALWLCSLRTFRRYFSSKNYFVWYILYSMVSDFERTSNTKLLFVFIIMKHRKRTKQRERYAINVTEAQSRSYSSSFSPYYYCYYHSLFLFASLLFLCCSLFFPSVFISSFCSVFTAMETANQSAVDSTTDFNVSLSYKIVEYKMFEKYILMWPENKTRRDGFWFIVHACIAFWAMPSIKTLCIHCCYPVCHIP